MTASPDTDPTMNAITTAVDLGRDGETEAARKELLAIWADVGVLGDPLHRCTLAHYLADLYPDPAAALIWDVRALEAADALTDQRAQAHDAGLHVAGFYPSLHLNIADNLRRLAAFDARAGPVSGGSPATSSPPWARRATRRRRPGRGSAASPRRTGTRTPMRAERPGHGRRRRNQASESTPVRGGGHRARRTGCPTVR